MPKPGLGQRLVARIKVIKAGIYRDDAAKFGIKVTEFALDHRYPPGSVFKWAGDVVVPDYETILRLARDLEAPPGWLHYGDGGLVPKAPRRQGRRPVVGSLLLALSVGAASLLGWPSSRGTAEAASLHAAQVLDNISLLGLWLRKAWARALHTTWCPA